MKIVAGCDSWQGCAVLFATRFTARAIDFYACSLRQVRASARGIDGSTCQRSPDLQLKIFVVASERLCFGKQR
jgi:hypothetical protein